MADCNDLASLRARSEIARISDNVYLSNFFAAKCHAKLAAVGITHILVCAQELPHALANDERLTYESLKLADNPGAQLPLAQALAFIASSHAAGGRVLCHCAAGGSRSAAVVIAWLMQERNLTYDEALAAVRKQRSVQPNMGFEAQLRAWENHLTAAPVCQGSTPSPPQGRRRATTSRSTWRENDPLAALPRRTARPRVRRRPGTTLEFLPPPEEPTGMCGGGPFNLLPGQWTDDTSPSRCASPSRSSAAAASTTTPTSSTPSCSGMSRRTTRPTAGASTPAAPRGRRSMAGGRLAWCAVRVRGAAPMAAIATGLFVGV